MIGDPAKKMLENAKAMGAIQANQIEPRFFRPFGGIYEPAAQIAYVRLV